jgi:putative transposase
MDPDGMRYRWRRMTPDEREAALCQRCSRHLPWHGPPHYAGESGLYLLTAACYEHRPIVGLTTQRMAEFESRWLETLDERCLTVFAWVLLPNQYHALLHVRNLQELLGAVGQLHGRTSFRWNGEEGCRGRQVWHRGAETEIKSERHFWATMNYVLHNAVRHGYVRHWQEWPYSNAAQYLAEVGRAEAERRWREYPLLDYGKDWDAPEL